MASSSVLRDGSLPRTAPLSASPRRVSEKLQIALSCERERNLLSVRLTQNSPWRSNKGLCWAAAAAHLRPARLLLAKKRFACGRNQDNECADVKFCHSRVPPGRTHPGHFVVACHINFPQADRAINSSICACEERADFNFRPLCGQSKEKTDVNCFFVTQFDGFNIHERTETVEKFSVFLGQKRSY